MAIELLVDGAADAVRARRKPLDEAPRHAIHDAPHHEIDEVLEAVLRQHRDVLDDAQRLDAPPRLDLVLHVVEQARALAVAARQENHLVGLRRLVDVDETLRPDVEIEPGQIAVVIVHFLGVEGEFVDLAPGLLDEDAALAGLDRGQPLGALVGAVADHDRGRGQRLIEIRGPRRHDRLLAAEHQPGKRLTEKELSDLSGL